MGMIYKRPKSPYWWIKYYKDGRPIRESTETDNQAEARDILRKREGDSAAGRPITPRASRVRFEDLAEDFLSDYRLNGRRSLDRAEYALAHLRAHFAGWRAMTIKAAAIKTYIEKRQGQGAKNATINRELDVLNRMFSLALAGERLPWRPHIPKLIENNIRTGFFSELDFLALHEALPTYLRPVVTFAYTYGWRKGEILGLTWDRVDLAAGTVRLDPGSTKNREGRTVVLTEELRRILGELWDKARVIVLRQNPAATAREIVAAIPYVFHRKGRPIRNLQTAWEGACRRAGLPGRIFHDFRRTAIRNMVRAGIPERVAMMISGHKTRSIFDRYDIVSEGDLRQAAEQLTRAVAGTLSEIPTRPSRAGINLQASG